MADSTPRMATGSPPPLRMRLVVDVAANRVVFAEAGKDVADFLLSLLALPLARVAKLAVDASGEAGAVGSLRRSAAGMDPAHVQPGAAAESLLWPTVLSPPAHTPNSFHPLRRRLYTCNSIYSAACGTFVTDGEGVRCPSCGEEMAAVARYVAPPGRSGSGGAAAAAAATVTGGGGAGGFVRGGATYVVMDDLTVAPMPASVVSSVELLAGALGALSVGRVGKLQEKNVVFGSDKSKEILKASLQSKTVLTDVFLGWTHGDENLLRRGAC